MTDLDANHRDEQAIRAIRDELNQAIADRATAPFAKYWLDDVQITAGSGEVMGNSRDRHVRRFVSTFADPAFVGGVRTPASIQVNAERGLAAEHGSWLWQFNIDGKAQDSRGTYLVMWRKVKGGWRIQAELYVML
jgi:ketosteroid isomerase-like protein